MTSDTAMELSPIDLHTFRILAEALAIGLLVGIERYKSRRPGETSVAGVRTFALAALFGSVTGLIDQPLVTFSSFVALASLVVVAYFRSSERGLGATTEIATLLVFWLGFLLHQYEALAISIAILVVILLSQKRTLHAFVRQQISEAELYETLKFLAVVLVIWPLLPDREFGPYAFLNPAKVWLLVIVISSISYFGYVLMRWLGGRRGLYVGALIGGIVSTTATVISLAQRAGRNPEISRACGVASVLANSVQTPRLVILIAVLYPPLASVLAVPFLGMAVIGLLGSRLLTRRLQRSTEEEEFELSLQNPYSLTPALKFAAFFVGLLFFVDAAGTVFGVGGVFVVGSLGGAASVSAAALSVAQLAARGELPLHTAGLAIFVAWVVNAVVKWAFAWSQGNRTFAFWLGGGLVTMLAVGLVLLRATGVPLLPPG